MSIRDLVSFSGFGFLLIVNLAMTVHAKGGADNSIDIVPLTAVTPLLLFENNKIANISNTADSVLSLSTEKAKDGIQSLKWQYQPNSKLKFNSRIDFQYFDPSSHSQAKDTFVSWIYNAEVNNGQLLFEFATGDKVNSSFRMNLNFTGWRSIAVPFVESMDGSPLESMDNLVVSLVGVKHPGILYFDQLGFSLAVDPRWPTPDHQVPFVNPKVISRVNQNWNAITQFAKWEQEYQVPKSVPNQHKLLAITKIEEKVDRDLVGYNKTYKKVTFIRNKSLFNRIKNKLDVRYNKLLWQHPKTGKPLKRSVQRISNIRVYREAGVSDEQLEAINKSTVRIRDVGEYLFDLALVYRRISGKELLEEKQALANHFYEIVTYLEEQGFAYGSGLGILHHQGFGMREWAKALFLMRDVLGKKRHSVQQTLSWYLGLGRIFRPKPEIIGLNVDVMNTMLPGMLFSILMLENEQKKLAYLKQFSDWISYSMISVKGVGGGIQRDGSFLHHAQHYVAYARGGLGGLSPVVYYLSKSPFQLKKDAYERLRLGVEMLAVYSNDLHTPMSLSGRKAGSYTQIKTKPLQYLIMAGHPDKEGYDEVLAATYLRLTKKKPKDKFAYDLKQKGYRPSGFPQGSWVLNYSSMAVHRRDNWLLTARGFSRYLSNSESYANDNHFGRYNNYGHVELLYDDHKRNHFQEDGFNWNRWPGITSIQLPFKELAAKRVQKPSAGDEEMLFSDETFSGANHLQGLAGMFAMKLHEHAKYNESFRARKSVFLFDDLIVNVGTNIVNDDKQHPTETTLFQDKLTSPDVAISLNGVVKRGVAFQSTRNHDTATYLLDTQSNGYYIPPGQTVAVTRERQHSQDNKYKQPTQGNFATAIISHGFAPKNERYEYAIVVKTNQEAMAAFTEKMATTPAYQILQADYDAHIAFYSNKNIMAYSLFEANQAIQHGLITSVSEPVMVMTQLLDGKLNIALTDPDLNLYQGKDPRQYDESGLQKEISIYDLPWINNIIKSKKVRFVIRGKWRSESLNSEEYRVISVREGKTVVEVRCYAAEPIQMIFKAVK